MKKFIVVNRLTLQTYSFDTAESVALFFWGKIISFHIIIKDEDRVVKLNHYDIRDIQQELEAA
jgi:hypothetical protein